MSYRCVTINISLLFQDNKMKFSGYEICLAWLEIDQSTCKYKNQPDWSNKDKLWLVYFNSFVLATIVAFGSVWVGWLKFPLALKGLKTQFIPDVLFVSLNKEFIFYVYWVECK